MSGEQLDQTLQRLHEELSRGPEIGPDERELLNEIARDIRELTGPPPEGIVDRLREATAQFEESHPRIAAIVGRLSDTLSSMGI